MSDWPDAMEWYDKVTALEADNERLNEDRKKYFLENLEMKADNDRLRAALKVADVALDTAECVIDADGEVEAFHQVQAARKAVRRALEPKP